MPPESGRLGELGSVFWVDLLFSYPHILVLKMILQIIFACLGSHKKHTINWVANK
jgi:hypothetical protein